MPIHGCICHVCISGREMNAYLVVLFRLFGQGDSMPVVHGCNLPVGFSGIKMYMVVSLPICLNWAGGVVIPLHSSCICASVFLEN